MVRKSKRRELREEIARLRTLHRETCECIASMKSPTQEEREVLGRLQSGSDVLLVKIQKLEEKLKSFQRSSRITVRSDIKDGT